MMKTARLTRANAVHRITSALLDQKQTTSDMLCNIHEVLFTQEPCHLEPATDLTDDFIFSWHEKEVKPTTFAGLLDLSEGGTMLQYGRTNGLFDAYLVYADSEFVGVMSGLNRKKAIWNAKHLYYRPNGQTRTLDDRTAWTAVPYIDEQTVHHLANLDDLRITTVMEDGVLTVKFPKPKTGKGLATVAITFALNQPGGWDLDIRRGVKDDLVITSAMWQEYPKEIERQFAKFGAAQQENVQEACTFLGMLIKLLKEAK